MERRAKISDRYSKYFLNYLISLVTKRSASQFIKVKTKAYKQREFPTKYPAKIKFLFKSRDNKNAKTEET